MATLIYAGQSVLSKVVEENIPSMEVVLTRSVLGGAITLCTLLRIMHNGNRPPLDLPYGGGCSGQRPLRHSALPLGYHQLASAERGMGYRPPRVVVQLLEHGVQPMGRMGRRRVGGGEV